MAAKQAFSLLELSIVLVIIGLLSGGILGGTALIRAAELRGVSGDTNRYLTSVYSFRDKYAALPGDMSNATQFWSAANATPATCQTTPSNSALTCDGNGNGQVDDGTYEMYRFWQHLANAGLIEGSYTGVTGPSGIYHHVMSGTGTNAPRAKISNGGYGFSFMANVGNSTTYKIDYGNIFWFGVASVANVRPQSAILKPEEAWNIDTKMDDGIPVTGKYIARPDPTGFGQTNSCTTGTSNTDTAATYLLLNSAVSCAFMIRTGF